MSLPLESARRIHAQVKDFLTAEDLRYLQYPRAVINYILILYASGICAEKAMETANQLLERKMNKKEIKAFISIVDQAFDSLPVETGVLQQPVLPDKNITFLTRKPKKGGFAEATEWHSVLSSLYRLVPAEAVNEALEKIPRPSNFNPHDWRNALREFERRPDLFGVLPFRPSARNR